MTLADDLLPLVFEARGIRGALGFAKYTVELWLRYKGQSIRETAGVERMPIVEGDDQPPRVRWLKDEEIALGSLSAGTVEIGAITPRANLLEQLQGETLAPGDERHIFLRGPKHPNGALYLITMVKAERALRWMIQAKPTETTFEPA